MCFPWRGNWIIKCCSNELKASKGSVWVDVCVDKRHHMDTTDFVHGETFSHRDWHSLLLCHGCHGTLATRQPVAPISVVTDLRNHGPWPSFPCSCNILPVCCIDGRLDQQTLNYAMVGEFPVPYGPRRLITVLTIGPYPEPVQTDATASHIISNTARIAQSVYWLDYWLDNRVVRVHFLAGTRDNISLLKSVRTHRLRVYPAPSTTWVARGLFRLG